MKLSTSRLLAVAVTASIPAGMAAASTFTPGTFTDSESVQYLGVGSEAGNVAAGIVGVFDIESVVIESATLSQINPATYNTEAEIELGASGFTLDPFFGFGPNPVITIPGNVASSTLDTSSAPFTSAGLMLNFIETFDDDTPATSDALWDELTLTYRGAAITPDMVNNETFNAGNLGLDDDYTNNNSHVAGGLDFYDFTLTEDGLVTLTTENSLSAIDTEIGLYDSTGTLINNNDDSIGLLSSLTESLVAGDYTLVVGTFDTVFDGDINNITAGGGAGDYTVDISVRVPEPGSLALLGLGGLAMLRRRR